ncbi:MAG TPA: hypothetical protein VND93_17950 [Myxococcales bacterium]|jgi:hypothetical protein|nr:hypothetical protein [Myxococcales bacterium]
MRHVSQSLILLAVLAGPLARANPDQRSATYERLVLVTKEGKRVEGRQGTLGAASLTFTVAGAPATVPLGDIKTLYVAGESLAGTMALCGAGVGLVLGFTAAYDSGLLGSSSSSALGPTLLLMGGLAGGGALIGGVIGASMIQWRVQPIVVPGQQAGVQLSLSM